MDGISPERRESMLREHERMKKKILAECGYDIEAYSAYGVLAREGESSRVEKPFVGGYRHEVSSVDDDIGEDFFLPYLSTAGTGQVVDKFEVIEKEVAGGKQVEEYGKLLVERQLETLAEFVDYGRTLDFPVDREDNVTAAVDKVIATSLERTFGKREKESSVRFSNSVANQEVAVTTDTVKASFGPVAGCVGAIFDDKPSLGIVLAWYARAVVRGYAGPIKLTRDGESWALGKGSGDPVHCLKVVLATVLNVSGSRGEFPRRFDKVNLPSVGWFDTGVKLVSRYDLFPKLGTHRTGDFTMEMSVVDTTKVSVEHGACVVVPGSSGYERVVTAVAKGVAVKTQSLVGCWDGGRTRVYLPRGYISGHYCGIVTRELVQWLYTVGVRQVVVVTDELGVGEMSRAVYVGHFPPDTTMHLFWMVCFVVVVSALASIGSLPWFVMFLMLAGLSTCLVYCVKFWFSAFHSF